jgi:hypothetical protein
VKGESSTGGVRPNGEGQGLGVGRPGTSRARRARRRCPLAARLGRGGEGRPRVGPTQQGVGEGNPSPGGGDWVAIGPISAGLD